MPRETTYLSLNGLLLTEAHFRTWFSTHADDGIRYFAAVDAAEIKGVSVLQTTKIENAELMVLAIRPVAQGQGIGGSLLDHALQTVRVQGYRTLLVKVFADNRIMQRLLLSRAFQPIRMEHHGRWDGGDMVWWKITL